MSRKFSAEITWNNDDIYVEVEYDYQPRERQTLEHPGADEDATITRVVREGAPEGLGDLTALIPPDLMECLRLEALEWEAWAREEAEA